MSIPISTLQHARRLRAESQALCSASSELRATSHAAKLDAYKAQDRARTTREQAAAALGEPFGRREPAGRTDIVVIGGSAGSFAAIAAILAALPHALAATIFIALHRRQAERGALVEALSRHSRVPLRAATNGERIRRGIGYVCTRDEHMIIERGRVRLEAGPAENLYHPSIDALFRTAAHAYGPRVVGVVLSGVLRDGTAGLWQVKNRGGIAIVQDPGDAQSPQMPKSAIDAVEIDYCLPARDIGAALAGLAAPALQA